jgi:glycosyltransferase involved in cell wall biosynthesis
VIHACNPPDNIFLIARVFRLFCGTRFVFDHHDGNPELWVAKGGASGGRVHRALCFLERQSFRTADVSLAVNDHFRKVAESRGGMDHDSVFLVRNAPDRSLVEQVLERTSQLNIAPTRQCVVGFMGVMGVQDGVANLMHVIHLLVTDLKRDDIVFRIMGDGPELKSVKALAVELGIQDYVEFTGWVSGDDYLSNLASCDIGVNADTANGYNEYCSPNKIYEYMLFGLPIVQFDLPEAKLVSGGAALNARENDNHDLAAKLMRLADDETLRADMGSQGRARVLEHFLWDNSERELLKAYQRILPLP